MAKRRVLPEFRQERTDFVRFHSTAEKQLLPIFRRALAESIQPVIDHATEYGLESLDPASLINGDVWNVTYQKAFRLIGVKMARREYYRQRGLEPVAQKESVIGFLVDKWTQILREYALNYTYGISKELNARTVEIITEALGEDYGIRIGQYGGIELFIKNLKDKFKARSVTIARTEATTIANLGKFLGAQSWIEEQGGNGFKVWLGKIVGERPTHLAENDTIVSMDDLFIVGGEQCERPGDIHLSAKERINCRCTVSYISNARYQQYVKRGRIQNGKLIGAS